jgi:hypothetical protein
LRFSCLSPYPIAWAGSTLNAALIAKVLANAQMSMVSAKPIKASWVNNNTNLGKMGAQIVAAT